MQPYGFNWTHPGAPLAHPWRHYSAEQLGANPLGLTSAAVASYRIFPTSGYVALVLPFLSTTLLPEQRGTADEVLDFRAFRLNRSSTREPGAPRPSALYFCVRLSWDGEHLHQLCDPNDATGRTVVPRAHHGFSKVAAACPPPARTVDFSNPFALLDSEDEADVERHISRG